MVSKAKWETKTFIPMSGNEASNAHLGPAIRDHVVSLDSHLHPHPATRVSQEDMLSEVSQAQE